MLYFMVRRSIAATKHDFNFVCFVEEGSEIISSVSIF